MSEKDTPEPVNEVQPSPESPPASTFSMVSAADMERFTAATRSSATGSSDGNTLDMTDPFNNSLTLPKDGTSGGTNEKPPTGDAPSNGPSAESFKAAMEKSAEAALAAFKAMGVGGKGPDGTLSGKESQDLFEFIDAARDDLGDIDESNEASEEQRDADNNGLDDSKEDIDKNGIKDAQEDKNQNGEKDSVEALRQQELAKARSLDPNAKDLEYKEGIESHQKTDRIASNVTTTNPMSAMSAAPVAESQVAAEKFETARQIGETKPDGRPAHDNGKLLSSQNQLELALSRLREAASRPGGRAGSDGGNGPSAAA